EAVLKSQFTGESNTIELYYMPSDEEVESNADVLYQDAFTQEDITAIEAIPEVEKVVATSTESSQVRYQQENTDGMIMGINQAYLDVQGLEITEGRNLLAADFLSGARVAVVSDNLQVELFDDEDKELLGKVVYMDSYAVEIVGVGESEDVILIFGFSTVYVPMKTWQSIFSNTSITQVSIQAVGPDEVRTAGEKAALMLNQMH